jgi:hypothetical protein
MLSGISRKECFFFAKWTIWGASAGFPSRNSESAAHLFFSFLFVIADVHFQTDGADDRTLIRSPPSLVQRIPWSLGVLYMMISDLFRAREIMRH